MSKADVSLCDQFSPVTRSYRYPGPRLIRGCLRWRDLVDQQHVAGHVAREVVAGVDVEATTVGQRGGCAIHGTAVRRGTRHRGHGSGGVNLAQQLAGLGIVNAQVAA